MSDERRKEIQRLADRHQDVCRQQIQLDREIEAAGHQMSPEQQARLARLIEAEKQARVEFNSAREGWHERVLVTPIR